MIAGPVYPSSLRYIYMGTSGPFTCSKLGAQWRNVGAFGGWGPSGPGDWEMLLLDYRRRPPVVPRDHFPSHMCADMTLSAWLVLYQAPEPP